jgi:hypothetical protein
MTSASTERRAKPTAARVRKRADRLVHFAHGWLDGVDSNIRHKRQAAARAQVDVVRVALTDVPGLVEEALAANVPHANAEIQRLRAAMVHAMDDAQSGAMYAPVQSVERARFLGIARRLKSALEKK